MENHKVYSHESSFFFSFCAWRIFEHFFSHASQFLVWAPQICLTHWTCLRSGISERYVKQILYLFMNFSYEGVFDEYLHVKFEVNEVITILSFVKWNKNYVSTMIKGFYVVLLCKIKNAWIFRFWPLYQNFQRHQLPKGDIGMYKLLINGFPNISSAKIKLF